MKVKIYIGIITIIFCFSCTPAVNKKNQTNIHKINRDSTDIKVQNDTLTSPKNSKEQILQTNSNKKKEHTGQTPSFHMQKKRCGKRGYIPNIIDSATSGKELVINKELVLQDRNIIKKDRIMEKDIEIQQKDSSNILVNKNKIVDGYRIQVYATTNFKEAERKKRDISSIITEKVYVIYEAPYYKIRVGNFIKESDTRKVKHILQDTGYDTWVVNSQVRIISNSHSVNPQ